MITNEILNSITTQRYVAMLDIMGFKSIVKKIKPTAIYKLFKDVYIEAERQRSFKCIEITMFSDTIIIASNDDSMDSYSDVVISSALFINLFIKKGYAINGAIAFGEVTFDKEKNICFGQPIVDAHILQEDLFFYGVVLHESANKRRLEYHGLPFFDTYRPDFLISLKVPIKSKGWQTLYVINWCETFNILNTCYQDQIPQIKKSIKRLYCKNKNNDRGIFYVQNTEIVLKQWYDFVANRNEFHLSERWGELMSNELVTKCPFVE